MITEKYAKRKAEVLNIQGNGIYFFEKRRKINICEEGWSMGSSDRERKTGTVYVPSEIAQNLKTADEDAAFK